MPPIDKVAVIDLTTMKLVHTLQVPKAPQAVLIDPAGEKAYISCQGAGQIAVINLKDWQLEKLIAVGRLADGMAWARSN